MKISINWLKEYIQTESNPVEISEILTNLGLEVEKIDSFESVKGGLKGVVAGKVIKCEKHPNADRLKLTSIDLGNNQISEIVCGAPNIEKGQIVPVAVVGSKIYTNDSTEIKIKKSKIRGVVSNGMVCAEDEIGLGDSHDGIMVLDKNIKPGTPISEVFNIENDNILEIGLTPNRCDAMSHYGVARDLKAYYDYKSIKSRINLPSINSFESVNIEEDFNLDVIDKEKCPFYSGLIIKDIKVKKSSDKLQNKLKSIGLKPINNIVDITNFVMHEIGQPLHAFDFDKLKNINVKSLKSGTKFKTLDDEIIELSSDDLMICSENKPLCIAGIYGGLDSGVSDSTKNLFLESAIFNSVTIRKSSKRHQLFTDASYRYERGVDPEKVIYALKKDDSPEGISRVENVQELLNGIRDFIEDQKELVDSNDKLSEFLSTVSLSTDFDIENQDQDKVSLMTLHLSKGLEFKHVFIVGLEEDLFPSALSYNTRSELEEERRLFYVGITRAKENLYLSYANSRYRWGKLIYCEESRFLNEIDKDYVKIIKPNPIKSNVSLSLRKNIIYKSKPNLKRLPKISTSIPAIKINVSEGDSVSHEKFGIGEIIKIEGSGNDSKATVNFKKFGLKNLLLRFAKLNKV